MQPFGHNKHGLKLGEGLCPVGVELGPHLTQCCPRPLSVASRGSNNHKGGLIILTGNYYC